MDFFKFPPEIRLLIYEELFLRSEPIVFVSAYGPPSPPLFLTMRYTLCPTFLRTNRTIYNEASPVLYSKNNFQFPDVVTSLGRPVTHNANIRPFLSQIGHQATLVQHIHFSFPAFDEIGKGEVELHEAHIQNLEALRRFCSNLKVVEMTFRNMLMYFHDLSVAVEAVNLVNNRLKTFPALKEVILNVQVIGAHGLSDDLREKMLDCGWKLEISQFPKIKPPQKTVVEIDALPEERRVWV